MEQDDLERVLRSALVVLRPYSSDIVLIGGWVPYLYRHYGGFQTWGGTNTLTFELDVLVPQPLAAQGRSALVRLLTEAGFQPEADRGPAGVWIRDVMLGEKIEFFSAHRGTARTLGGFAPVEEQPGVTARMLAELEVLAENAQTLALPPVRGLPAAEVQVPTLGAYALNKALTFIRRGNATENGTPKAAKDLLYISDLVAGGADVVNAIEAGIQAIAKASDKNSERIRSAATNMRWEPRDISGTTSPQRHV